MRRPGAPCGGWLVGATRRFVISASFLRRGWRRELDGPDRERLAAQKFGRIERASSWTLHPQETEGRTATGCDREGVAAQTEEAPRWRAIGVARSRVERPRAMQLERLAGAQRDQARPRREGAQTTRQRGGVECPVDP